MDIGEQTHLGHFPCFSMGALVLVGVSVNDLWGREIALFDMPNSNRFNILSISIFSEIS